VVVHTSNVYSCCIVSGFPLCINKLINVESSSWCYVLRSHYRCCYFVLPCCTWDFTKKFSDRCINSSHYRTYLNYIHKIGETCGFIVNEDVLRIPSTKRVSMFYLCNITIWQICWNMAQPWDPLARIGGRLLAAPDMADVILHALSAF